MEDKSQCTLHNNPNFKLVAGCASTSLLLTTIHISVLSIWKLFSYELWYSGKWYFQLNLLRGPSPWEPYLHRAFVVIVCGQWSFRLPLPMWTCHGRACLLFPIVNKHVVDILFASARMALQPVKHRESNGYWWGGEGGRGRRVAIRALRRTFLGFTPTSWRTFEWVT